ncbi:hypothetical protein [Peribacillus asahii]|uniref:hypothetical protein n=1 Tax=Peribacillus asahii TaxID=228899 RepID=UPI00207A64A2|nr:hypothetical protein [Peribacillus asahii]USK62233.1 hypothetical protein LIT37_23965 [Peribacillus asahii]
MLTKFYWSVKEFHADKKRRARAFIASRDGHVYEVRDSEIGRMAVHAKAIQELDLVSEGFRFDLPLVPTVLFQQIYSFFKYFCSIAEVEVMLQLFYDRETKAYFLECPIQTVNKVAVKAEFDKQYLGRNSIRYLQVAQFHSHNTMEAYFSKTDDRDEKAFMIYGVMGRLHSGNPQMVLRVKANDSYVLIPITSIFEDTSLQRISFPDEWLERITIKQ